MNDDLQFAVIGAGGFARFAVTQFVKREGVRLAGVFDRDLFHDQLQWLVNRGSLRKIDASNAVDLVFMAERAEKISLRL